MQESQPIVNQAESSPNNQSAEGVVETGEALFDMPVTTAGHWPFEFDIPNFRRYRPPSRVTAVH